MKKYALSTLIILMVLSLISWERVELKSDESSVLVKKWVLEELKLTQSTLTKILSTKRSSEWIPSYHQARKHYKHIEFFVEYYSPREAKLFINGPLVPKHDPDFGNVLFEPQGFQRMEEIMINASDNSDTTAFYSECRSLLQQFITLESYYEGVGITDAMLIEMCQLQLFRIASLNLNGYDATISQTNIQEIVWCMEGIETVVNSFKHAYSGGDKKLKSLLQSLVKQLTDAKNYLIKNTDYVAFNRLHFIVAHINPLNKLLVTLHHKSELPWSDRKQALNFNQEFLFGEESFNKQYFSIYYNDTLNLQEQAALGKRLFFDPGLSGNNKISCATCHNPSKAFSEDTKNLSIHLSRNIPTLLNVIYQKAFFYDGRAYQLEQQAFDVIHNEQEMQSSLEAIATKLLKKSEYQNLFKQAFKGSSDTAITSYSIQKALTEYEKTLVSLNSRFDKYVRGELKSLTAREINGYNLFAGKGLCASCHFFPLFNGTVPPAFSDTEFEVIGTPADAGNKSLDQDEGRYAVTKIPGHLFAFKTPTIRNVTVTAPYMHNGVYNSLEEVVEFYHRGGGKGFGFDLPNQTLPFDSLQLSVTEKEDIVLFLKTLTDLR